MFNQTIVSFPGLGIEPIELNKIAFTLFGRLEVRWYGLIITLGIIFAVAYAIFRGKKHEHVISDDLIDIALLTVILGVIGARAYYVLTTLDQYKTFGEAIAIWNGGLGIYGGIIGGCIGIVIMCYFKKISWRKLFDMAAPGVMIAQATGRWGNFFNGEAYGYSIGETTRFFFFNKEFVLTSGEGTFFHTFRMGLQQFGYTFYYHPTFLYESVWNVIGFIIVNILYKHKRFHGQWALFYFTWYGFGRMFIEGFRTDSLYVPGTGIRISQLLGFLCVIIAGTALLVLSVLTRKREPLLVLENAAYEAAKKVEAELAESEEQAETKTATKTDMQKIADFASDLWQKIVKCFSKKESTQEEEKKDGDEN